MPAARGALDGMNAAVVGLLAVVATRLAMVAIHNPATGRPDWVQIVILAAVFAAILRGINATWLILIAGLVGVIRWYLG